jgi:zinc protease
MLRPVTGQQESPPPPGPARAVRFPKPVEETLSNGLRVIVIAREGPALASAALLIKSGSEVDPPGLAGLADITASLLTEGTTTRSAPEIAEAIETLGGSLTTSATWDASIASVGVMSAKLDQALSILSDVVRHPAFKREEIERVRRQRLDDLQVAFSEPGTLAGLVAARTVFGNAPYGHPATGTPESLARITRRDIARLHATYYRPDNAILVIGGRVSAEAAFQSAQRLFGDWRRPAAPLPILTSRRASASPAHHGPRVIVVDKPDAGQAAVIVIRSGLRRTDPDYFRGLVTNSVLGGGYSARLNQEIRIKRGLSYGAGSTIEARRERGPFAASTQTRNESGARVAALIVGELKRLAREPVAENELVTRKAALIGSFSRSIETTAGLVGQVATLALYGLDLDEINNFVSKVQAVTSSDVQQFASKYLDPQDVSVVIVGNAKVFLNDLRKEFGAVEVIPARALDLNSASLRRMANSRQKAADREPEPSFFDHHSVIIKGAKSCGGQ